MKEAKGIEGFGRLLLDRVAESALASWLSGWYFIFCELPNTYLTNGWRFRLQIVLLPRANKTLKWRLLFTFGYERKYYGME